MNIQKTPTLPVVHKLMFLTEETDTAVASCGARLTHDTYIETEGEITCKRCLQYLAGGDTVIQT